MKNSADLLFELANNDRLEIVSRIQSEPLKLSQIAQMQNTTAQETLRHLKRLSDAMLIRKRTDGSYELTPLGRASVSLILPFDFLSREREFILSHELSSLPPGYIGRIGELGESNRFGRLDDLLAAEERILNDSKEYVWLMMDQLFAHHKHQVHRQDMQARSRRLLLPMNMGSTIVKKSIENLGPEFEVRYVDAMQVAMALNENSAALVFQSIDGRLDYGRSFVGDSVQFHSWCHDLFSYFWDGAKPS